MEVVPAFGALPILENLGNITKLYNQPEKNSTNNSTFLNNTISPINNNTNSTVIQ
ncbi:MAG: hypothetical protein H0X03_08665 [Nitrosopumilus sp.]|nr:hypothetical protein [Nitrosopumilus sp.]